VSTSLSAERDTVAAAPVLDPGVTTPGTPLRIAMVAACPLPERRGTPVRIQRIAEALQRLGHDVHLVTYPYGSGDFDAPVTVHRIRRGGTHYRTAPGPSWSKLLVLDPMLARLVRRVLREEDIDVIHAHHYEGLLVGLAAARGTGVPLIYDAHTLLGSELPSYGRHLPPGAKRAVGERLDRWLPTQADHVISVSDTIREYLLARTPMSAERITCVSNGVECGLFQVPAERADPQRGPTIVFTGNLAPYQGIELLLEVLRQVLAARPNTRLRIVTESSFAPYEARARALGVRHAIDVVTAGFDAVPRELAAADVAVNPRPDCDGIPLKLLNYMAASCPVVSFVGSAPGVEHGTTGWLVAKGDVSAFAAGVLTLLDDPAAARAIGARARRHVELRHSWEAVARQTEHVYRTVVRRRRVREHAR
jgi:glycosyltransferase involved in cell wall biosynthesis